MLKHSYLNELRNLTFLTGGESHKQNNQLLTALNFLVIGMLFFREEEANLFQQGTACITRATVNISRLTEPHSGRNERKQMTKCCDAALSPALAPSEIESSFRIPGQLQIHLFYFFCMYCGWIGIWLVNADFKLRAATHIMETGKFTLVYDTHIFMSFPVSCESYA